MPKADTAIMAGLFPVKTLQKKLIISCRGRVDILKIKLKYVSETARKSPCRPYALMQSMIPFGYGSTKSSEVFFKLTGTRILRMIADIVY